MKTTYNKRETAQRERAKNLAIYNEVAAIAREIFNYLDIEAGTYSAAQVATAINKEVATWDDSKEDYLSEVIKIEIDGFSCRFPRGLAFDILNKMGTGYNITSSARVTFERSTEANERRAADIQTAAERQAQAEAQAQAAAEAAARLAEEKRARRRENDRRRRAAKKAQAQAERAQAQAEAQAAEAARRAAMTPADIERERDRQRRRAESSARRGRYIYEHSTKFSCGSDIELINKIIVVTIEANDQKIFKCWAVGACDSFYYICGSLTENNYIKDSNRSYKKENRAAVANWIYLTRQAAQKNGWNISIYSETPAPAAGYFVPAISTAAEDTIKRAQAAAAPAADIETPAAVPSIESTTANDDTAAPAADIETPAAVPSIERDSQTRRRAKSWRDIEAQLTRIKAAALEIVVTREGHSDGRTKEDHRLYYRLSAAGFIKNLYIRRIMFFEARQGKRIDRAALVPASIFAPLVPDMRAETSTGIKFSFIAHMEPGGWEPSANTFAELCEGLKHSDTRELCRAEIERRAIEAAHKFTAELGTIDRSATANELTAVFLSGVDRWAAETAPRFATVDDFINDMVPTSAANDDTANDDTAAAVAGIETPAAPLSADIETRETAAAPAADIETPAAVLVPVAFVDVCETAANDDTAAPGFASAPVETPAPLHFWHPANDDTRRPAVVLDIETGDTPANDDTAAHGQINAVFRYLLRAAAVVAALLLLTFANDRPTIATARPAADIERETPAAVPSIESTTANDGAPAVLVPVANDDTAAPAADIESTTANDGAPRHRSTRPRRRAVSSAKVAAPAADIESTTARDTTANDDTARALLLTVANDTTANDTARAIVAAPTLYEAGEITETSDTAAAVVLAAADIESTTANDDTQTATAADIETSDTAAPSIESTTANDDTANDDTANDGAPATTGTTTPAAPAAGCPAAVATPCPPAAPVAPVAPIIL